MIVEVRDAYSIDF